MPTADASEADALPPELKRRALEALEAPELHETPLPSGFATLLRLWHYEEEGPWRAWSVSARPSAIDAPALRIRRVVWDRPGELAELVGSLAGIEEGRSPRLRLSEARFPMESWSALLEEVHGLRLQPLFPEVSRPEGGIRERWGLTYRLSAQRISFEWWDAPPAAWKELAEWTVRLRSALEAWLGR
ncbi:hypothetical protein [Hyalangium versicolor]|uniref:hypothetical protein n=1 Tax=Hyalangium versicolor TaxID=2861190 RepID=UPI001CCE82AB|nr:hypothetical protein [Hyalangium versicolor]